MALSSWEKIIDQPQTGRAEKPRLTGLTMVIDKGLPIDQTRDWLALAASYVDLVKFTFGTSALYPKAVLAAKIQLLREEGIGVFPGGTLLEIAVLQEKSVPFLDHARELGFDFLEISDGSITMSPAVRKGLIQEAKKRGFRVLTEVGKKKPGAKLSHREMRAQLTFDLEEGADFVIIEGRESGKSAGLYDEAGEIDPDGLENLLACTCWKRIIWEAPLKKQQLLFIKRFGPNVNLGNIPPGEILALEALRRGLRADTLLPE
jgi:phosphosulfolactate synthase